VAPAEVLTTGPTGRLMLICTLELSVSNSLCARSHIYISQPQRHHVNECKWFTYKGSYAAYRKVEFICLHPSDTNLQEQAAALPELMRPIVLPATLTEVIATQAPDVRFDRILGRAGARTR